MKMRISYIAAALVAAAAFVSCQKDEIVQRSGTDGRTLSATIEDDATRTHLGDWDSQTATYAVVWDSDNGDGPDKIKVVEYSGAAISHSAVYQLSTGNGSRDGIFVSESSEITESGTSYRAYSPSTIADDPSKLQWPSEQHYRQNVEEEHTGLVKDVPMLAVETTLATKFRFRNLGGILQLNVNATDAQTITKIVVKSAQPISGAMTVVEADDDKSSLNVNKGDIYASIDATAGSRVIEYILPSDIPVGTEALRLFHISMPVGTYSSLAIEFYDGDGNVFDKQLVSGNVTIKRSMITTATFQLRYINRRPAGTLSGLFTVNSSGKQVRFAQGNLQYQASTGTWRFAENQYDVIGNNPGNTTIPKTTTNEGDRATQQNWIDLMPFGSSSADNHMPYGASSGGVAYFHSTVDLSSNTYHQFDWGYKNAISNGGNKAGLWRVLTQAEWQCLLGINGYSGRDSYLDNKIGEEKNKHYARIRVNGIAGLLLFPDVFTWPETVTDIPSDLDVKDITPNSWTYTRNYSLEQFSKIESAGAVFLPLTGFGGGWDGYSATLEIAATTTTGCYWFASTAYHITTGNISENGLIGQRRSAVRLVQDYTPKYNDIDGTLPGMFSVSDTKKVYFSQGNLQYQGTPTGSTGLGHWKFAEHQYDIIGADNGNIDEHYTGWIDMFGFGTSGIQYSNLTAYQPWSTDHNYHHYAVESKTYTLPASYDWGYNKIDNGGGQNGLWRTLTADECTYLLDKTKDKRTYSWARVTVNGIQGIMLFPDGWTNSQWPTDGGEPVTTDHYCSVNKSYGTYTVDNFVALAKVGVVFLPFAGRRYMKSYSYENFLNDNYHGYQTSTVNNGVPYFFKINQNGIGIASNGSSSSNHTAYSVRLVRDVK